eukprot:TRINITY_DN3418_c0_g1_i1.p1 TRINITY_DN3418_c0_g1~~TRINITY_DN3418_c0_g1_i1.p1  ORF type:complete len:177 (+),score=50.25 TRINITY_DN3418_c0_g1_i1:214-744(+)
MFAYRPLGVLLRRSPVQQSARLPRRGIEEFYEAPGKDNEHPQTGRPWRTDELRLKSFSDLHKLWFVLLKERNVLMTQREEARIDRDKAKFPVPYRLKKVKLSMSRIKVVLSEREIVVKKARAQVRVLYEQKLALARAAAAAEDVAEEGAADAAEVPVAADATTSTEEGGQVRKEEL